jgi:lysophospholipase L1-like esterase
MLTLICLSALSADPSNLQAQDKPPPSFALKDGDRVVLVGSAWIEREQCYGDVEAMLHVIFPRARFTVRNLGWSGDTVWGDARAGFGTSEDGFTKLVEQVNAEKPTVLFLGYGTNESFNGPAGVERFVRGYDRLFKALHGEKCQTIFLAPPSFAKGQYPATIDRPNYENHVRIYQDAIRTVASKPLVTCIHPNLYDRWKRDDQDLCSDDGILPNALGYRLLASKLALSLAPNSDVLDKSRATAIGNALKPLIVKKNELYFHRYRPQNDTYLHGIRKHEQGQNAKEVPQFDPMVEELDRKIIETKLKLASEKK